MTAKWLYLLGMPDLLETITISVKKTFSNSYNGKTVTATTAKSVLKQVGVYIAKDVDALLVLPRATDCVAHAKDTIK